MQAHTRRLFVDYAALSNNQCVSEQLVALGRKRIHFHGNRRQNAGVEHALLEQLTLFSNESIILEDVDTHRSPFRRRVKAQTKRRQSADKAQTNARKRWHGAIN